MLSKRENYTRILRGLEGDRLPFVPNFDHWLYVNSANGTLPDEFRGLSRNDIVRAVGGTVWARTGIIESEFGPEIAVKRTESEGRVITEFQTPVGAVRTVHQQASDLTRAWFLTEHRIKSVEDIAVVRYIVEHTGFRMNSEPFLRSEKDIGPDGISLVGLPYCLPYIEFGKTDAGWERGIYLFADHQAEVEALMDAYTRKNLEAAALLAASPALVIASNDNMDEWTTPPHIFRKYAIPYYRRIADVLHGAGKVFEVHWCGRTEHLLALVPECGIDVVEAVTVAPMSAQTVPEALRKVGDRVVIQGGIPSILLCPQGGSREQFASYLADLLAKVPRGRRFVLGMSDNVPPDADFERVKIAGRMVDALKD